MQYVNNLSISSKTLLGECMYKLRKKSRIPSTNIQREISKQSRNAKRRRTALYAVATCSALGGSCALFVNREMRQIQAKFEYISELLLSHPVDMYIYVDAPILQSHHHKKSIFNILLFPRLQYYSNDPWILLKLAQSSDSKIRAMGVKALSRQHHWHDSEFCSISQACDRRTVVGLARYPNTDPRFFRRFRKLAQSEDSVEEELQALISGLPREGVDRCTLYFTEDALKRGKTPSSELNELWTVDGNGILTYNRHTTITAERIQAYCLQALFAHSQITSHCKDIVRLGGLKTLQRFYEKLKEGKQNLTKVSQILAKILANLCVHEALHDDIIDSGWLSVLHQWLTSEDLGVVLYATKALVNLDRETEQYKYVDGVHLYHPQHRSEERAHVDVVFVHGLLGGPLRTWRQDDRMRPVQKDTKSKNHKDNQKTTDHGAVQKNGASIPGEQVSRKGNSSKENNTDDTADSTHIHIKNSNAATQNSNCFNEDEKDLNYSYCWPRDWLAVDCPHMRIITVEYDTHLSEWGPKCPYDNDTRSMYTRSKEMVKKLRTAGIGDRPIIWVGHSMGGLMIKEMLVNGVNSDDPASKSLVDRTRGVLFYSTPHLGAPMAWLGNKAKYLLLPSVEVLELRSGSQMLKTLHSQFRDLVTTLGIQVLSLNEGSKVNLPFRMKELLVPPDCSDPGFGEVHVLHELNHLNICKPHSRDSQVYQMTLNFVRNLVPEVEDELETREKLEEKLHEMFDATNLFS